MGIRENLLIKYETQRDTAMAQAGRIANQVVAALADVSELRSFVSLDLNQIGGMVDQLKALQRQAIEADRNYRQHLTEA